MARKKKATLVAWLLDRSGSMFMNKEQTISGFNEILGTLKGYEGTVRFTLTMFNAKGVDVIHNNLPIQEAVELTPETYRPAEGTPLYDAIGQTIQATEAALNGESVLFYIQTDGLENASKEWTRLDIFRLIQEKEAAGWQFVFLGADQDAYASSEAIGIAKGNTVPYEGVNTEAEFRMAGEAAVSYMAEGSLQSSAFVARHYNKPLDMSKKPRSSKAP